MSLWFSASVVLPALKAQYAVGELQTAALSSGVALDFVVGTLLCAILGLADRLEPRHFFAVSALVGAVANSASIFIDPASFLFVVMLFVVGTCIAGIYSVAIKTATT
jgi:sugar phosphate permease